MLGSTGFIGSRLIPELLQKNISLRLLAGPLFPFERLRERNAEFLRNLKDAAEQAAQNH